MTVFDFNDYKEFTLKKIKSFPKKGRGQLLQIAKLLDIHTTMVTHIFKGNSHLNIDQSLLLATHFGLNQLETEYFVTLVNRDRSINGNGSREYFSTQLSRLKDRTLNLKERIESKTTLKEEDQAIFYSAWYFSAVRLITALKGFSSAEVIAKHFGLSQKTVNRVIEFLVSRGLCKNENGKLSIGETQTFVDRDSLLIQRHHSNWRLRIMEQLHEVHNDELVFTNPITIAKKDFAKIREELVLFIDKYRQIADPSDPQELCCLNIDWVRIKAK